MVRTPSEQTQLFWMGSNEAFWLYSCLPRRLSERVTLALSPLLISNVLGAYTLHTFVFVDLSTPISR